MRITARNRSQQVLQSSRPGDRAPRDRRRYRGLQADGPHRRQHRGQTVLAGVGRDDVAHQPAANHLCPFQTRSRNMNVCPRRFTPGPGARWPTLAACNSRRFTSAGRRSCVDRPITWISSPLSAMAIYATNTKRVTDEMFIEAAHAVTDHVSSEQLKLGVLFPPQGNVLEVAVQTPARVAQVIFDCWLGPRRSSDQYSGLDPAARLQAAVCRVV